MAIEIFIKFDGIDGESTNQDHKNEIDVLSWGWGVLRPPPVGAGTGSGTGKAIAQDLHFVHRYDKSSPLLAKITAQGRHVRQVTLAVRHPGSGQKDFLKITMKEVFIASVQPSGEESQGINELVSLKFVEIAVAYQPVEPTGQLGNIVKFSWNLATTVIT